MTELRKLLVANRGEIALRIFRTAREMGLATVAVFSDPDRHAPHVRAADEAVALGGAAPAESYLRADALVDAALRSGADAVHPGYGFLAENAAFARACGEAGLTFVGPSPEVVEVMGSKLAARQLAEAHGVPVLPAADLSGVAADKVAAVAGEVGWPLLVKASAGGGGRGMRIVRQLDQLADAVAGARREAASAFGDDTVFVERYVEAPRHIEVQVFGDHPGNVVSLFERECSIQRRHQKIVEECPSPFLDAALRRRMGDAAVALARAVGYVGAGTVEFVVDASGEFWFLEMNTRLQVEHPVTEAVTGLDLVRLQLEVAAGLPLPAAALEAAMAGHAIEVRLYAEDPAADWRPSAGRLHRFRVGDSGGASAGDVRVDAGVEDGTVVGVDYDPMLAKVICHAPTRREAAARLAGVLQRAKLHGPVTNRDLLVAILRHPEFLAGGTDTAFLERHPPTTLVAPPARRELEVAAVAAALAEQADDRAGAPVLRAVPSGFRNNPSQLQTRRYEHAGEVIEVGYRVHRPARIEVDGREVPDLAVDTAGPELVELVDGGVLRRMRVQVVGADVFVDGPGRSLVLRAVPRFTEGEHEHVAGSLVAPMPGKVVRVEVAAGTEVAAGQVLAVIEAMKMEHQIVSPEAGVVSEVQVAVGDMVDVGQVVAVVDAAGDGAGGA
ncbi:MAG TPA: biotin carboxylase N-terminal domain-containing protein [Acidimicrobiales bacterium]|nr:biotin carboxylase N-terminal domain-containing protein [Acidimicrobiales bacterium]